MEFMYLVFTCTPGESYRRQLRSLLLCLCDVFQTLINLCVDTAWAPWAKFCFRLLPRRLIICTAGHKNNQNSTFKLMLCWLDLPKTTFFTLEPRGPHCPCSKLIPYLRHLSASVWPAWQCWLSPVCLGSAVPVLRSPLHPLYLILLFCPCCS